MPVQTMPVHTMLVEDHIVLREGLRRSLEANGVSVVAEVGDGDQVVAAARHSRPDVVLMDLSLPGQDGIAATRQLKRHLPEIPVIILTMFADEDTVRAAFAAGAVGYLVKDCSTAEMVATVTTAALGSGEPRGGLASVFLRGGARRDRTNTVLTRREVEVLQMLANGVSSGDVATKLFISGKTVKNHLAHIYSKLGATSRTQAVAKAVRLGIVRIG
jgi:two-component system, NarL family, response regulator DegU